MTIGEALKRFRKNFGITQLEVSKKIGILSPVLCRYEANEALPGSNVIIKIAKAFGVSTDYLLGLSDNPAPNTAPVKIESVNTTDDKSESDDTKKRLEDLENQMARLKKIINF